MKLFAVAALASCALVQGLPLNMYTKRAFVEVGGESKVCNEEEVEAFRKLIKENKCGEFQTEKKCTVEGDEEDPSEDCGLLYEFLKDSELPDAAKICKGPNIGEVKKEKTEGDGAGGIEGEPVEGESDKEKGEIEGEPAKENRICYATAQEEAAAVEAEGEREGEPAKEKKGAVIAIRVGTAGESSCKLENKEASEVEKSHCGTLEKIVKHVQGTGNIEPCEECEGGTPEICPAKGCSSDEENKEFIDFIGIFDTKEGEINEGNEKIVHLNGGPEENGEGSSPTKDIPKDE